MYKVIRFNTTDEDILSERIESMCPEGYKFETCIYRNTMFYEGYVGVYIKVNII